MESIKLIIVGSVVVAKSTIGPSVMSLIDDFHETNGWQIRTDLGTDPRLVAKLELKLSRFCNSLLNFGIHFDSINYSASCWKQE